MATETNPYGLEIDAEHPHLGGFIAGGDPNTYFPEMWEWMYHALVIRSVVDVGCGDGQALKWWRDRGCSVVGVDGLPQDDEDILQHDYTTGPFPLHGDKGLACDLVWSAEFVEHVEDKYIWNYLETFMLGTWIAMTHAVPGQGGHHHVNCQPAEYWIQTMTSIGYRYDEHFTGRAREHAHGYFAATGLVFRRISL